jgi:hypothetical protein
VPVTVAVGVGLLQWDWWVVALGAGDSDGGGGGLQWGWWVVALGAGDSEGGGSQWGWWVAMIRVDGLLGPHHPSKLRLLK